jgi:hypothetical protein
MRRAILMVAGVLTVFTATSALAQIDGLERFEREVKPQFMKDGAGITYKDATALGPSGFVLSGVTLTEPAGKQPDAKPSRITIERLTVEDIDFDRIAAGQVPEFVRLRAEGVMADDATGTELAESMKSYDIPNVPLGFVLDYRQDSVRKVFALNRLEVTMPGLARIEFGLTLDGVASLEPPKDEQARELAAAQVALRTASLTYDDASLLRRILTAAARDMATTPDNLVGEAAGFLAAFGTGQPSEAQTVVDALVSFVEDWRQPAGPIRVSLNPPASIGMVDYDKLSAVNALKTVFGLSVNYAGTRTGADARAAPPPPTTSPAPDAPATAVLSCKDGQRLFVLDDEVWWPATAREPAQGNRCIIRFDGENEDETIALESQTVLPWSFDGPGSTATACRKGSLVLVQYKGAWYRGRVKNDAPSDRSCPIKYLGNYDDENVPLGLIRLQDRLIR